MICRRCGVGYGLTLAPGVGDDHNKDECEVIQISTLGEVVKLQAERDRLADEVKRLTYLHKLDESLASQREADAGRLSEELHQLRQRVSPPTEACACPEFCTYHARAVFERQRAALEEISGLGCSCYDSGDQHWKGCHTEIARNALGGS